MNRGDNQHGWHGDRDGVAPKEILAHYLQGRLPEGDSVAVVTLLAPAAAAKGEVELQEGREVVGSNGLQVDGERGCPTGLPCQGATLCQGERRELDKVAEERGWPHPVPAAPSLLPYLIC